MVYIYRWKNIFQDCVDYCEGGGNNFQSGKEYLWGKYYFLSIQYARVLTWSVSSFQLRHWTALLDNCKLKLYTAFYRYQQHMHHLTDVSQTVCNYTAYGCTFANLIDIFRRFMNSYVTIILIVVDHQMISEGSIDGAVSSTDTSWLQMYVLHWSSAIYVLCNWKLRSPCMALCAWLKLHFHMQHI